MSKRETPEAIQRLLRDNQRWDAVCTGAHCEVSLTFAPMNLEPPEGGQLKPTLQLIEQL